MPPHLTIRRCAGRCGQVMRRVELVPFLPALGLAAAAPGGGTLPAIAAMFVLGATLLWRGAGGNSRLPGGDAEDGMHSLAAVEAAADRAIADAPASGRSTIVFAVAVDGVDDARSREGAAAAEAMVQAVGERLRSALRGPDRLARLDGATFAAALQPIRRADIDVALQVAARLQDAAAPAGRGAAAGGVPATVSIGFCLGCHAADGATALASAMAALAEARAAGGAAIRAHAPGRPAQPRRPGALDAEVVAALEEGEILPWFQPQISCATGAVSGFEALARWEHPSRGVIAPVEFLPVLEAAGLLDRLGRGMLYHGLAAMRDWTRAGRVVPRLGINFSADELRDPHLAERIGWELDRFDLTPDRLAVEVLESVVEGPGDDSVRRTTAELSRLGCAIDLDDFGTGSASLAALSRFAVTRIKIDRSFIAGLDRDPGRRRMVAAILDLAQRLEIDTIAEGVERVGEHTTLVELGCGHVQGFGIARPMPFGDTLGWMERHAERLALPATLRRRTH